MSSWLIAIVGVVSIGVLIEVLLPEGENSKYIRGVFAIVVIFVIISPLPKLAKGDYIQGFGAQVGETRVDEGYYESVKESMQDTISNNIQQKLASQGYNDLSYDIQFDEEYVYMIEKIVVYAEGMSESDWQELLQVLLTISGGAKIERL